MESKQTALSFASVSGKKLVADFDGGMTTSDGGVLLLRELEPKVGIIDRIVESLWDRRHQSYVDHSYSDLIKQRVFQISLDFGALKDIFKFLDHKMLVSERDELFLNSDLFEPEGVVVMPGRNPSVENVALYGMNQVIDVLAKHFQKR